MKTVAVTAIIFFAIASIVACSKNSDSTSFIPSNLNTGVLAFYSFGNGSISDASGNNHHLVNTTGATPAADRNGNPSCAYAFDGTQDLHFSNPVFLNNLSSFSISLWYAPTDSSRLGSTYEALVCRDTTPHCPDRFGDWSLGLYDCRLAVLGVQNSVWEQPDPKLVSCESIVEQHTGSWHHLAATFDGPSNLMKIYRDGVLQESNTLIGNCTTNLPIQNIGDLFLGKRYKGRLDDVILYNKALNQQEVVQLSQMAACCYIGS